MSVLAIYVLVQTHHIEEAFKTKIVIVFRYVIDKKNTQQLNHKTVACYLENIMLCCYIQLFITSRVKYGVLDY